MRPCGATASAPTRERLARPFSLRFPQADVWTPLALDAEIFSPHSPRLIACANVTNLLLSRGVPASLPANVHPSSPWCRAPAARPAIAYGGFAAGGDWGASRIGNRFLGHKNFEGTHSGEPSG